VIGIGGFALAYVVVFVFVLPTKIVPPAPQPPATDSAQPSLQPIDTGATPAIQPPMEPPPVAATITESPSADTVPVPIPDLIGMSLRDARRTLDQLRLRAAVSRDTSSFQPPNTVIRQSPAPESMIRVDGTVMITVSYFPPESPSDTIQQTERPGYPDDSTAFDVAPRTESLGQGDSAYRTLPSDLRDTLRLTNQ
jgi:hypothetical protein